MAQQMHMSAGPPSACQVHGCLGRTTAAMVSLCSVCLLLPRYETIKAADAVAALKASLKPTATVKRDGVWQNTDATLLVPGTGSSLAEVKWSTAMPCSRC
jgi:magnesium-transporting ATPase (P-type)